MSASNVSFNRGTYAPSDTVTLLVMQVLCAVAQIKDEDSGAGEFMFEFKALIAILRLGLSVACGQDVLLLATRDEGVKLDIGGGPALLEWRGDEEGVGVEGNASKVLLVLAVCYVGFWVLSGVGGVGWEV